MGTTESVFYDETPAETLPSPTRPSHAIATEPEPVLSAKPRNIRFQPHSKNGNVALRSQPPRRRRAPRETKPIIRMEGLVVGRPKTGKRTLLSRLRGVDPFVVFPKHPPNENSSNETSEKNNQKSNPSIIIPYKPPKECPTWDRIKLRIGSTERFDGDEVLSGNNIDFLVIMINPNDSRDTAQTYVEEVVLSYLERSGQVEQVPGHTFNKEGREKAGDSRSTSAANPNSNSDAVIEALCIAILFNFRDLQDDEKAKEFDNEVVSRSGMERFINKTLEARNAPAHTRVIEVFDTSLLNCYGLDGLHRFIYRAYLQRGRRDIERKLHIVRNQIQLVEENDSKSKPMRYDEFKKEILQEESGRTSQQQQQDNNDKEAINHRKRQPQDEKEEKHQSSTRNLNLRQFRRQHNAGSTSPSRIGKDALEAFLASSSDEEDQKIPANRMDGISSKNMVGIASSSSDDDSDDDFFYDENGDRRHSQKNTNVLRATAGPGRDKRIMVQSRPNSNSFSASSDDDRSGNEQAQILSSPSQTFVKHDALNQSSSDVTQLDQENHMMANSSDHDHDVANPLNERATTIEPSATKERMLRKEKRTNAIRNANAVAKQSGEQTVERQNCQQISTKVAKSRTEREKKQEDVEQAREVVAPQQHVTIPAIKEKQQLSKEKEGAIVVSNTSSDTNNLLGNDVENKSILHHSDNIGNDGNDIKADTIDNKAIDRVAETEDADVTIDDCDIHHRNRKDSNDATGVDLDNGTVAYSTVGAISTVRVMSGDLADGTLQSREDNDDGVDTTDSLVVTRQVDKEPSDEKDATEIRCEQSVGKELCDGNEDGEDSDGDYMIALVHSNNEDDDDSDNCIIVSASVNEKGEDDGDDDYMIGSRRANDKKEDDDDEIDISMLGSTPLDEEKQDNNGDVYMIRPTRANDNEEGDNDDCKTYMAEFTHMNEEHDDDDDGDCLSVSKPTKNELDEHENHSKDYMVDSAIPSKGQEESGRYAENSTPANDEIEDDVDDGNDSMMNFVPVNDGTDNDDDDYMIQCTFPSMQKSRQDDDEDSAYIIASARMKDYDEEINAPLTGTLNRQEDSSDTAVSMDRNNTDKKIPQSILITSTTKARQRNGRAPSQPPPYAKPISSSGISEAAAAAIAAAQKEAEAMVRKQQQQLYSHPSREKKSKKSKKKKDEKNSEKKKKKKKKEKETSSQG